MVFNTNFNSYCFGFVKILVIIIILKPPRINLINKQKTFKVANSRLFCSHFSNSVINYLPCTVFLSYLISYNSDSN